MARTLLRETVTDLDSSISCVTLGKGPHLLNFKERGREIGNENESEACGGQELPVLLHVMLHPQDTPGGVISVSLYRQGYCGPERFRPLTNAAQQVCGRARTHTQAPLIRSAAHRMFGGPVHHQLAGARLK